MGKIFSQQLNNLPQEILSQPRFFAVKKDKAPKTKGWSKPENQKLYSEIQGLAGFDTAGHGVAADYLFLDFDHVLNGNGEFVNANAAECFNRIQNSLDTYCELSASGHGIHTIAKPTADKFKKVSSGENGRIYFDADKKSFVEIFYGTGGRYCLFTGNVFRCAPKAPIAHGEPVDGVFQALLDVIAKRAKKSTPTQEMMTTREVADFLGVAVSTVKNWRQRKLFGCYFFPADEKQGDTLYYYRWRVEQLKAVYQFGILQNMYKLARKNPEPNPPAYFQKSDSSGGQTFFQKSDSSGGQTFFQKSDSSDRQTDLGEELSFRHREFFTVDEVADFFGVAVEAVKKWHQRGQLKEDMLGHNGDLYFAIDNVLDFTPPKGTRNKADKQTVEDFPVDDKAYNLFRAHIMLDTINPAALSDTDWLAVISSCKNIGVPYVDVDAFNRRDPERYDEQENHVRWDSVSDPSFDIETLHGIAKRFGYEERDARRQWFELHPELSTKIAHRPAPTDDDGKTRTRDKIKNCPADLILPDNFLFKQGGITLVVPPKKENEPPKYIRVARTPIIPTKIFREPTKNKFSYEIAILTRNVWRTVEIEGRALADPRAIIALADTGALILEPKLTCRFFVDVIALNPGLEEVKAYNQTGWTDDTFQNFAYPHSRNHIVRRAGFDFDRDLDRRGEPDLWKEKFIEVVDKGGAVVAMYIGTALAAVLARPLNIMNPQTHLHGTSGGGKTALQKFTASIFGNPRKLIRTFAATNKNRQLVSAAFCDLPTFYDELETIQGKAAEENLSNDIYNFAEGKGNQANKRDGTARETFEFGGARLTTGERPLLKNNDLRGAYKRLIQLDTGKGLFPDDFAADLHIFSESNFGLFGEMWIQYATAHMAEIQKKYQYYATCYNPTLKIYEPTHIKSIAAALVAFEFFKAMLGICTKPDDVTFIRNRRVIVDALPTIADLDDTERALTALTSYVASHEKSFMREESEDGKNKTVEIGAWGTVCSGKIFDTGEVVIFPTELKRILEDELGFASADKLINEWIRNGVLKTDTGRKTHQIRIGKKNYRAYFFKAGAISNSDDSAECSYYEELSATN